MGARRSSVVPDFAIWATAARYSPRPRRRSSPGMRFLPMSSYGSSRRCASRVSTDQSTPSSWNIPPSDEPSPRWYRIRRSFDSRPFRRASSPDQLRSTRSASLLGASRLVTVTGTGGSGKTRLVHQVALALAAAYPDGVVWVDLSRVTDDAAGRLGGCRGLWSGRIARRRGPRIDGRAALELERAPRRTRQLRARARWSLAFLPTGC